MVHAMPWPGSHNAHVNRTINSTQLDWRLFCHAAIGGEGGSCGLLIAGLVLGPHLRAANPALRLPARFLVCAFGRVGMFVGALAAKGIRFELLLAILPN